MSLTLHFHPLASYCHKVLIALYENDTPFTPNLVDLANETERAALLKLWPIGKFPVLRDDARNQTVPESTVILEYLDRHYPGRTQFIPVDADRAWQTRLHDRFYDLYCRRSTASRGQEGSARRRRSQDAAADLVSNDRSGDGNAELGGGRYLQSRRLCRRAGAVLCQRGHAVWRKPQERRGISRSPEGAAVLRARPQGGRAVFRDVPEIVAIPPAITSEIISQDMSVPQNSVRLVNERWFAACLLN